MKKKHQIVLDMIAYKLNYGQQKHPLIMAASDYLDEFWNQTGVSGIDDHIDPDYQGHDLCFWSRLEYFLTDSDGVYFNYRRGELTEKGFDYTHFIVHGEFARKTWPVLPTVDEYPLQKFKR